MKRANSRSRQLSVLASFPRTSLISHCQKMQHRTALTPKNCPGQLSQVPTLKRLREYGTLDKVSGSRGAGSSQSLLHDSRFTVTRAGSRVFAGKRSLAAKDPGAPKRALTNYNSFLRTHGLFERLCGDLHAGSDDKVSFRDRLGSVVGPKNGTDDPSPWITVAKARSFPTRCAHS